MSDDKKLTAFRLGTSDRKVLAELQKITGLVSAAEVVRLALRESLAARKKAAR